MYGDLLGAIGGRLFGVCISQGQFGTPMVHGQNLCAKSVQKTKDEEKTLNQNIYIDVCIEILVIRNTISCGFILFRHEKLHNLFCKVFDLIQAGQWTP